MTWRAWTETQNHFERRVPFDVQCRVRHKDGSYRWLQSRAQALWDEQGRPYRMVGATTDITERKQAEEDARRWQQVFEQAEFGLAHADLVSETFLAVNRAFARQSGYTVEELIGRPVLSVYAPGHARRFRSIARSSARRGISSSSPFNSARTARCFRSWSRPCSSGMQGRPHSRVAYVKDLTELKQVEAKRQEGETHLSLALAAAGEGTFDWNVEDRTIFSPRGWRLSASAQVILRRMRPVSSVFTRKTVNGWHNDSRIASGCIATTRRSIGSGFHGEETMGVGEGARASGSPGRVTRAIGVLLNITERKRVENALRRSEERFRAAYRNATIGMSIADVTGRLWEVNQTLCTILGYSEEELLTRTYQSLTHPDDLGQNLERVRNLLSGELACDVFENGTSERRAHHLGPRGTLGHPGRGGACAARIGDGAGHHRTKADRGGPCS